MSPDPKFDVPVLEVALRLPLLGYVGAKGSRRTSEQNLAALRALGLSEGELADSPPPTG